MGQISSTYMIPLKCFANQVQNEILNANHNFRVSLTLDQLANVIDVNALTGTPNINFNSISLLVKMQKLIFGVPINELTSITLTNCSKVNDTLKL